ncbi:MAG: type VI secretion system baseplate subunit TssG [Candidatus Zixiibacteriota bacterium]|nr:MAG: type VI secretion system baseplate subunit TssG [candidate division Zixibacteria bacterium]
MASANGIPADDLIGLLISDPSSFTFFQAVRLLRRHLVQQEGDGVDLSRLRMRPHLALDHPSRDLAAVEPWPDDSGRYTLTATFLGLYGVSSPLPAFYTEDLLQEQFHGGSAGRDFLDLIHTVIYRLLVRAWQKYHLGCGLVETADPAVIERLYCLAGAGAARAEASAGGRLNPLRYIALAGPGPRTAEGLHALLCDFLGVADVDIIQGIPRFADIPPDQQCRLGQAGCRLGLDCSVGSVALDRTGKFGVALGPLNSEDFHRFLPGSDAWNELQAAVAQYLDKPLVWTVTLKLYPELVEKARLGSPAWSQLGWNTWIYTEKPADFHPEVGL